MINNIQKFVLTGGPYAGKTTLLNLLAKKGFQTVQEAAVILIKEFLKEGKSPWKDVAPFQERLLKMQLDFETKLEKTKISFIDRGIIDGLAYCKYYKIKPPKDLLFHIKNNRYSGIFLLDFLPGYKNNNVRKEPFSQALEIQKLLKSTYEDFGYNVIQVPAMQLNERADFICNNITNFNNLHHTKSYTYKNLK